jgi:hypothetical protein
MRTRRACAALSGRHRSRIAEMRGGKTRQEILLVLIAAILLTALALWLVRTRSMKVALPEGTSAPHETSEGARLSAPDTQASRDAQPGVTALPATEPSGSKSPRGSVRGRFLDESNAPVAGVEVWRLLRRGEMHALATSGDDGRFRFEVEGFTEWGKLGLTLSGRKPPYVPCRLDVVALKGEEIDLGDLVLRPGGSVSGRVVDTNGLGVESARVSCTEAGAFDRKRAPRIGPGRVIAETNSGAGGEFLLEGAQPGQVRMWAGKKGMRHAFTEPIEVRAGESTSGVVLVLAPRSSADDFEIQVLKPDRSPCAGADIDFRYDCRAGTEGGSGGGNATADEQGHLTLTVWDACPYRFDATDPDGLFGPASMTDVMPGSGPIVLQLVERVPLRLRVVDERSAAVESFRVRLVDPIAIYRDVGPRIEQEKHPGGVADLAAPAVSFLVTVESEGFELAKLGPYEPGEVPKEIDVRLVRVAGISGRVTAAGKPIEGAKVELYQAVPELLAETVHEFATRHRPIATAKDESDGEGTFQLTLRNAGRYFLRAEKSGWASAEIGPLDLDPKLGAHDLELDLTAGGSIEGHLLLPASENPGGSIVGLSRGDAMPRTLRLGGDGAFLFEHLTPGRWLVKRCESEVPLFGTSVGQELTSEPVQIPWNCEVFEGKTTNFDIDLRVDRRVKIVGRLLVAGRPATPWRVSLQSTAAHTLASAVVETNAQGEFVLFAPEPGSYLLNAHGALGDSVEMDLTDHLDLSSGDQAWTGDLPASGRVEGHRASGPVATQSDPFLQWLGPGQLQGSLNFPIDARGIFNLPLVPSGPCKIQVWTTTGKQDLASFEVRAGETTVVALP